MNITPSKIVEQLPSYAFCQVDQKVEEVKKKGIVPIDFGVGDPRTPTPSFIREAAKQAIDLHAASGYPSYTGSLAFRKAVCKWMKQRFSVELDPEKEVVSSLGSKEAIFHFPKGFVDPGDYVLTPTPGYPPFYRGALFAGATPYFYPLKEEHRFLPPLSEIPTEICQKAKILWINYPNNPTGATITKKELQEILAFCRDYDIILASDEAYTEIYFEDPPPSALEVSKKGVVAFHSLSKRSAMTGYRVGWVTGDAEIIQIFKKVKTNIDSGTPHFIQEAAIAALSDEEHVAQMREEYKIKREILRQVFQKIGFPDTPPRATIHYWQKLPEGVEAHQFFEALLEIGIVTTPGEWISEPTAKGENPGRQYIRFALVPTVEETREAAKRISQMERSFGKGKT